MGPRMLGTLSGVPLTIRFPDPEYAEVFQAYVNYIEDLAGSIGGRYGLQASLVQGVHDAVAAHPPVHRIQRRNIDQSAYAAWQKAIRKSWGQLRRIHREVADPDEFDEEANATLPVQAYYAVYHAVLALTIASRQPTPRDHAAALKVVGQEVMRGRLPYPWDIACTGCPQLGSHQFHGFASSPDGVHVLARPDPATTDDRVAMFLRTT